MEYLICKEGGVGEIEEKKSRFIATIRPVSTEEEARAFIEEMKKKYWDARHNCHAFILGEKGDIVRFSDDGEPSGTAGKPILEVLSGAGIKNVCCVVTRYFGGVLLGTGGLVRAYGAAASEGLHNCKIARRIPGMLCQIRTDYSDIGKILHYLEEEKLVLKDAEYGVDIKGKVLLDRSRLEAFEKAITEMTAARAVLNRIEEREFDEIV